METDLELRIDEMLRTLGYATVSYKGWRLVGDALPGVRGMVRHQISGHPDIAQADFEVMLPGGATIVESYGVIGESAEAREIAAITKFAQSTLHVLLAALREDESAAAHVSHRTWQGPGGVKWDVWGSEWQVIGYGDEPEAPSAKPLEVLGEMVAARLGGEGPHWMRIMRSQIADAPTTEVLWDNAHWAEAEAELAKLEWPARAQTARQFVFLQPAS